MVRAEPNASIDLEISSCCVKASRVIASYWPWPHRGVPNRGPGSPLAPNIIYIITYGWPCDRRSALLCRHCRAFACGPPWGRDWGDRAGRAWVGGLRVWVCAGERVGVQVMGGLGFSRGGRRVPGRQASPEEASRLGIPGGLQPPGDCCTCL